MFLKLRVYVVILSASLAFNFETSHGQRRSPQPAMKDSAAAEQPRFTLRRQAEFQISPDALSGVRYGSCTYIEIMEASQQCESLFFRHLVEESCKSCSTLYQLLQKCVSRKWASCNTSGQFTQRPNMADNQLVQNSESTYCNGGTLSLPGVGQPINYCSPRYSEEASKCLKRFHAIFRNNLNHPDACAEYAEARKCFDQVQDRLCNYPKFLKVMLDVTRQLYRCWNPFCVWKSKRLPGAVLPCHQRTAQRRSPGYARTGIASECVANSAAVVSDWPSIDQVTFGGQTSSDVKPQLVKVKEERRLNPNAQKQFVPPGKTTAAPPGGSSSAFVSPQEALLLLNAIVVSAVVARER